MNFPSKLFALDRLNEDTIRLLLTNEMVFNKSAFCIANIYFITCSVGMKNNAYIISVIKITGYFSPLYELQFCLNIRVNRM